VLYLEGEEEPAAWRRVYVFGATVYGKWDVVVLFVVKWSLC